MADAWNTTAVTVSSRRLQTPEGSAYRGDVVAVAGTAPGGGAVALHSPTPAAAGAAPATLQAEPPGALLAAPVSRQMLLANKPVTWSERAGALVTGGGGRDESAAYWRPDARRAEVSLLEALFRRRATSTSGPTPTGAAATSVGGPGPGYAGDGTDFLLLHARPEEELRLNFSNHLGQRVDLSLECFRISKAARAVRAVGGFADDATLSGRDMKRGLRSQIPMMLEDEHYLVSYRDYSDWAVQRYPQEARKERAVVGAPFVERFFAVRVGQGHGVFLPISEAQFRRGWEMIAAMAIAPGVGGGGLPADDDFGGAGGSFLNADQFKSLGGVHDPDNAAASAAGAQHGANGRRRAGCDSDDDDPSDPRPAPWDFTPRAMTWRWRRYLRRQYKSVGQFVVKGAIVLTAFALIRYALQQREAAAEREARMRRRQAQGTNPLGAMATMAAGVPYAMMSTAARAVGGGDAPA